ncbi:CocE/NonD family hydrolase, partial [Actinospica durhamensis]
VIPEFTWADPYDGLLARGGAHELGLVTQWTSTLGVNVLERRLADRPDELRRQLAQLDDALDAFPDSDAISRLNLPLPRHAEPAPPGAGTDAPAHVPAFIVAGWYDCFLQGSLDAYARARRDGTPVSLIVGPWSHDNQTRRVGEIDFGAAADAAAIDGADSLLDRELDWLGRQLEPHPTASEQSVLVFVTGADTWRRMPHWPPAAADTSWFLHDGGVLSSDAPEPEATGARLRTDPSSPVTTHGGAVLLSPQFPAGPYDQQQVEKRDDVLVYTSAPLALPLEVMGRVRVDLAGESTADVTDWVARLCDVAPDGVSRNITDGILRAHGAGAQEHRIDLWSTAHVFQPGHRIRLQVTGSCFPRWDLAPSGARRIVFHDPARRSRLVLPVVSRR